jgi:outer membrane protein TolC
MKIIIFVLVILLRAPGLFSDTPPQTINLEQARMLALANSRSLAKYSMSIRSSILDEKNQLYSMLPSLSASYSATMSYMDRDWGFVNPVDNINAGASFSVTQKIFEGGKSFIQKELSAIATESVRKDALAEYFSVLDSADNAYYAVLEAAANLEAAESSLRTAVTSLSIAEIRQASGMLNSGDYLRALAEKESRENMRNQARRNHAFCVTRLKALIGNIEAPEFEEIDFAVYEDIIRRLAGISDEDAGALYREFYKILLVANPSLAKAALNNQRAEKNLSLARRDYFPTISATIFALGLDYSSAKGFENSTSGGFSIRGNIPIDFFFSVNRIEKSKISRDMAALDYIGAISSLETDLESALINAIMQAESVLSSRRSLEYAEKHFEYVMERYRLSQSSISDLQDASSLLITSRNNLIKASYGFLQSLSRLRSMGAIEDEQKLRDLLMGLP